MMLGALLYSPSLDGKLCVLQSDYHVYWLDHEIIVPQGFDSDYASVPRILWRIMPPHHYPYAAIAHDWAYAVRLFPRDECDQMFYEILLYSGCSKIKAHAYWAGVRIGGYFAYNGTSLKEVNMYREAGDLPLLEK